jgi:hypothetical protein
MFKRTLPANVHKYVVKFLLFFYHECIKDSTLITPLLHNSRPRLPASL